MSTEILAVIIANIVKHSLYMFGAGPQADADDLRDLPPVRHDLRGHQPRHVRLPQRELQDQPRLHPLELLLLQENISHEFTSRFQQIHSFSPILT